MDTIFNYNNDILQIRYNPNGITLQVQTDTEFAEINLKVKKVKKLRDYLNEYLKDK